MLHLQTLDNLCLLRGVASNIGRPDNKGEKLMKINKEKLAQAYKDLKGDLDNQAGRFNSIDTVVVQSHFTDKFLSGPAFHKAAARDYTYICTVEEFNNYSPEETNTLETEYLLRTEANSKRLQESITQLESAQEVKSPCKTKQKLHTAKNTILGMEMFLDEVGLLEVWNDNKSEYLGEK